MTHQVKEAQLIEGTLSSLSVGIYQIDQRGKHLLPGMLKDQEDIYIHLSWPVRGSFCNFYENFRKNISRISF